MYAFGSAVSCDAATTTRSSRYSPELLTQLRKITRPAISHRYLSCESTDHVPFSEIGSSSCAASSGPLLVVTERRSIQMMIATHASRITTAAAINAAGPYG